MSRMFIGNVCNEKQEVSCGLQNRALLSVLSIAVDALHVSHDHA